MNDNLRSNIKLAPQVGERYRLKQDVERYPFFLAKAGMTGTIVETIVEAHDDVIRLKMDETLENCTDWDNCIEWYESWDMLGEFFEDTEMEKI